MLPTSYAKPTSLTPEGKQSMGAKIRMLAYADSNAREAVRTNPQLLGLDQPSEVGA